LKFKPWVLRALILILIIAPGLILPCNGSSSGNEIEAKAAIIDQLYPSEPGQPFIDTLNSFLQDRGFKVDYYRGQDITVDFYRNLPHRDYSLIIFRAHSGLLSNGTGDIEKTFLFTNEPYSETSQIRDMFFNRLSRASVNDGPPLFGIGADFVSRSMRGNFNNAVVIMIGCSSLERDDLAKAFIGKGASAYTGWNCSVGLYYAEDVILTLLGKLCREHITLEAAVRGTMQEKGADPQWGSELKCCSAIALAH
jgi:hypothetical protein